MKSKWKWNHGFLFRGNVFSICAMLSNSFKSIIARKIAIHCVFSSDCENSENYIFRKGVAIWKTWKKIANLEIRSKFTFKNLTSPRFEDSNSEFRIQKSERLKVWPEILRLKDPEIPGLKKMWKFEKIESSKTRTFLEIWKICRNLSKMRKLKNSKKKEKRDPRGRDKIQLSKRS